MRSTAPTTLSQTYDAFIEHLRSLAQELARASGREGLFDTFCAELRAIELTNPLVRAQQTVDAKDAKIDDADVGVMNIEVGEEAFEGAAAPWERAVESLFALTFRPALQRNTLVVSIARYDDVAGSTLMQWLLRLLGSLPNTVVLVERSPGAAKPPVVTEERIVPVFTRDEVATLLAGYLDATADGVLVDTIHEWSSGHPATAALAGRFLRTLDSEQTRDFVTRLRALPEEFAAQRIRIALELVCAPGAVDLADIARSAAVLRRFDADQLASLVEGALPDDALDRLLVAGVMETVGDPADGLYRVQTYLREPLLELVQPKRRRQLHARAASHLYLQLSAEEPELGDEARSYEAWYRYEKPQWQELLREWLYHQRQAAHTDNETQRARLRFARIFLDAFWWWGCYLDFPFCHDLVADWENARDDDAEWVQDLRLLLDSYPTGWRKRGEGNWADVGAALVGVRESCGIAEDVSELRGPDARHTRGLVDNFLAHSYRYRATADDASARRQHERAAGYYDEAAGLFAGESWELAWTLFETAELHSDVGRLDAARELWRRAAELAPDEEDEELIASLHRLRADILWQAGEHAGSFDSHGRALLHAYFFQCKTPSRRPDAYTLAFYLEQVERVHERLSGLDAGELPDAVARLRAPFAGSIDTPGDLAAVPEDFRVLAGTIVPPAPGADDLLRTRSPLSRRIDMLAEELGDEAERDLEGLEL